MRAVRFPKKAGSRVKPGTKLTYPSTSNDTPCAKGRLVP